MSMALPSTTHARRQQRHCRPALCRGLSLVELLVGTALGLFIVSAGLALLTGHLHENRSLVLEARLMQDLRAASDAITRDLRRAGHWGDAGAGLWRGETPARANPYLALPPDDAASDAVRVHYSRDNAENHHRDANETFGFRLREQGIDMLLGEGNWQALTDPGTVQVTALRLTPHSSVVSLPCDRSCPPADPAASPAAVCPPRLQVRLYTVELSGRSPADPRLQRSLHTSVRVRNDAVIGQCPA